MLRVVTWNMDHWRRRASQRVAAWDFLRGLKADYALLQEAMPPKEVPASHKVHKGDGIAGKGRWGSAVVSFSKPLRKITEARSPYGKAKAPIAIHRTVPGSLAVADAGNGLVLVSAYGAFEEGYTVTTVHRLLSDLTPLLDSSLTRGVILAGDLNLSTQMAPPHRTRHRNALERFATLGLVDCLRLRRPPRARCDDCSCADEPCEHVQTQRHPRSRTPWQTDYVFVSEALVPRVKACFPIDRGDADPWELSDHCPIVLELDEP